MSKQIPAEWGEPDMGFNPRSHEIRTQATSKSQMLNRLNYQDDVPPLAISFSTCLLSIYFYFTIQGFFLLQKLNSLEQLYTSQLCLSFFSIHFDKLCIFIGVFLCWYLMKLLIKLGLDHLPTLLLAFYLQPLFLFLCFPSQFLKIHYFNIFLKFHFHFPQGIFICPHLHYIFSGGCEGYNINL